MHAFAAGPKAMDRLPGGRSTVVAYSLVVVIARATLWPLYLLTSNRIKPVGVEIWFLYVFAFFWCSSVAVTSVVNFLVNRTWKLIADVDLVFVALLIAAGAAFRDLCTEGDLRYIALFFWGVALLEVARIVLRHLRNSA